MKINVFEKVLIYNCNNNVEQPNGRDVSIIFNIFCKSDFYPGIMNADFQGSQVLSRGSNYNSNRSLLRCPRLEQF